MPEHAVLVCLINETLESERPARRRAAELLVGSICAKDSFGAPGAAAVLANPGLPRDVRAEIDRLVVELALDN
jgi:hypothetical protein